MEVGCIIKHCTHLSYHCPRYIVFIDLTKAFNLVIRKGLFTLLQTMGCSPPPPLKLLRMITSFVRSTSDPFPIKSFHTLRHVFLSAPILRLHPEKINGVYLHTRSDGNLARLRAITKVRKVLIREMLS